METGKDNGEQFKIVYRRHTTFKQETDEQSHENIIKCVTGKMPAEGIINFNIAKRIADIIQANVSETDLENVLNTLDIQITTYANITNCADLQTMYHISLSSACYNHEFEF